MGETTADGSGALWSGVQAHTQAGALALAHRPSHTALPAWPVSHVHAGSSLTALGSVPTTALAPPQRQLTPPVAAPRPPAVPIFAAAGGATLRGAGGTAAVDPPAASHAFLQPTPAHDAPPRGPSVLECLAPVVPPHANPFLANGASAASAVLPAAAAAVAGGSPEGAAHRGHDAALRVEGGGGGGGGLPPVEHVFASRLDARGGFGGGGFIPASAAVRPPSGHGPTTPPHAQGSPGDDTEPEDGADEVFSDQRLRLGSRNAAAARAGLAARARAQGNGRGGVHQEFKPPRMVSPASSGSAWPPASPPSHLLRPRLSDAGPLGTTPDWRQTSPATRSAGSRGGGGGEAPPSPARPAPPRRVLGAYPPMGAEAGGGIAAGTSAPPGKGLANLGNTCFMNASLQVRVGACRPCDGVAPSRNGAPHAFPHPTPSSHVAVLPAHAHVPALVPPAP
jgi:hypothetical protein